MMASRLAAHVGCVHTAEAGGFRRQRDQFLCGGVRRRCVLQRSGEAHGAIAHGVAHQRLHAIEFGGGRRAVVIAQHHTAHLRGAHVAGQVDPHALLFQAREIVVKRPPVGMDGVMFVTHMVGLQESIGLGRDGRALAGDFGGDALVDLRRQVRIHQNGELGLAKHVDEPGGHHHAARINDALGRRPCQVSDGGDLALPDADVARVPRRPGAVDDAAMLDDDIVGFGGCE
jgi:hypothetical protein